MRGFKRSRALWDNARRGTVERTRRDHLVSLVRAILYELQPVRFSQIHFHAWLVTTTQSAIHGGYQLCSSTLPRLLRIAYQQVRSLTIKQWLVAVAVVVYYYLIRWIHEILFAGPFVLMVTALVGIFTIGLGDTAGDGFSAYSVFNRGFERLMGSIDADALLAQHVGMVMPMGGGAAAVPPNQDRPLRREEQQHRPAAQNHENDHRNDQANEQANEQQEENDPQQQDAAANRARRSGKKARRRNVEQRREIRRQREAAMAMGFGGNENENTVAMQRLIEDQVVDEGPALPALDDE